MSDVPQGEIGDPLFDLCCLCNCSLIKVRRRRWFYGRYVCNQCWVEERHKDSSC